MVDRKLANVARWAIDKAATGQPQAVKAASAPPSPPSLNDAIMAAQVEREKSAVVMRRIELADDMEKMATMIRLRHRNYAI